MNCSWGKAAIVAVLSLRPSALSPAVHAASTETAVSTPAAAVELPPRVPDLPFGKLFTDGPRGKPWVALTFDDGPGPVTPELLDLLKQRGAKATFFVLGRSMRAHPGVVRRALEEGHQVGCHSDTHPDFTRVPETRHVAVLEEEIARCRRAYEAEAGRPVYFLRMPYGYDRPWVKQVAKDKKLVLVNWSFGEDWKRLGEGEMVRGYLAHLHKGAILLMHDGGVRGSPRTVHVTRLVLDGLEEKKLEAVRLDTLLGLEGK